MEDAVFRRNRWWDVLSRRRLVAGAAVAGLGAVGGAALPGSVARRAGSGEPGSGRLALVYRGPATDADCAGAMADMLRGAACGLDVRFAGPSEAIPLARETLARAAIYAQPGGGDLDEGYGHVKAYGRTIRGYVRAGGRYLGVCLGAYLAGSDPGFRLLPVPVDQYIGTDGAKVHTEDDTVVPVTWLGRERHLYFQDGPYFHRAAARRGVEVVGTYPNGLAAAVIARRGAGRVGVVGPHPEATTRWYEAYGLTNPDGVDPRLGFDFVRRLLT